MRLLKNITVLDCGEDYISAKISLRLGDLGAHIIRLSERLAGDSLTKKSSFNQFYDGKSIQSIVLSRGKEQYAIENTDDFRSYLSNADIVIYNQNDAFWKKFGLSEDEINVDFPHLIMAEYSVFGTEAQGDEMLAQALSGIMWLSGNRDDSPIAMGGNAGSAFCASYLTQGILLALYNKSNGGEARKVSTTILEALLAMQFELITTSINNNYSQPQRAKQGSTHSYMSAPYGVYKTSDSYFAMSIIPVPKLADIMGIDLPQQYVDSVSWFTNRDEIMALFAPVFLTKTSNEWLNIFESIDVWCSKINKLDEIVNHEGYHVLDMELPIQLENGEIVRTTKCPYIIEVSDVKQNKSPKKSLNKQKPLDGVLVVDLSQFLSGPSATLQLADFGATVVKIERPVVGDSGRGVVLAGLLMDGESCGFLSSSRNKYSLTADLKNAEDKAKIINLIKQADVLVQNFRPAAIQRLGLDYESIKKINPQIIYAEVSGYGQKGCWVDKPGQDLIVQAVSGVSMLSAKSEDGEPIPIGLSVIDMLAGAQLVEGIMASLYNANVNGQGAHVLVTMLGASIDFQSDFITAYYRDNNCKLTTENKTRIQSTPNGYVVLDEMGDGTSHTPIMKWQELFNSPLGKSIDMLQDVRRGSGYEYQTTRCPIRLNGEQLRSLLGAPMIGEHTKNIIEHYKL